MIDVRGPEAFAASHRAGALNLQLAFDQLEQRIASYVPERAMPLAIDAEDADDAARAAAALTDLGYHDVTLPTPGTREASLSLLQARELVGGDHRILDVRTADEQARGTIPGALEIDPDDVPRAVAALPRDVSYAVVCSGGWRSSQAASWMRREGFALVYNVIDGVGAWPGPWE